MNTNGSIIKDKDSIYYAVDQAVWFTSDTYNGPWTVADHYPAEVRNIPPSCPLFNIKFVEIYDYSPDIVYTGYTAGYLGSFLYHGVVYYGTGYRYKPWYGNLYIPRPTTYGHGAKKKKTPKVNVSVGFGYGYPGIGIGCHYGGYGYPYGGFIYPYAGYGMWPPYVDPTLYTKPAPGPQSKPIDPVNIYNNRSVGIVKTETVRRNDPTKPVILKEPSAPIPDNIYADKDGNVFKKDSDGLIYQRSQSDWQRSASSPQNR